MHVHMYTYVYLCIPTHVGMGTHAVSRQGICPSLARRPVVVRTPRWLLLRLLVRPPFPPCALAQQTTDKAAQALAAFNAARLRDERVDFCIVPIGDGMALCRRR